jgi:hypothetical protein
VALRRDLGKGRIKVSLGKFLMVTGKNGRIAIEAVMEDSQLMKIPKDILSLIPSARKGTFFSLTFYNSPLTPILQEKI